MSERDRGVIKTEEQEIEWGERQSEVSKREEQERE